MKYRILFVLISCSFIMASDVSDVKKVLLKHYKTMNSMNWSEHLTTIISKGTINGDSNGEYWYNRAATEKALTRGMSAGDSYDFTPRYMNVEILETAPKYPKIAVAYHYLVGSYSMGGVNKSDYRTRVSHVLVTENGRWKIRFSDYTPLHSGSGIPD